MSRTHFSYPPSPPAKLITGHLSAFRKHPIRFMLESADECGKIALFRVLNKKIHFLNDPDYIRHVLQSNHKNYHKSPGYKPLRALGGMGIFTSDGEQWVQQRRLYQPAFSHENIKSYSRTVLNHTAELVANWQKEFEEGRVINGSREMTKITLSIISETLFSNRINYASEMWDAITYALEWISNRALRSPFVWPEKWPVPSNIQFKKSLKVLDDVVYDVIDQRKLNDQPPADLLQRFLQPDGNLEGLDGKALRDEVMTIFLAGHETSANVLMWALFEVARHPEVQEKIQQEIDVLSSAEIRYEHLHDLTYTSNVLNEVMRLYPPVWHLGRMNLAEDQLGSYRIPAGSHVRMSPLVIHRNKKYWKQPNMFNPDRFQEPPEPFTFIPFGAGPRLCAGRNFAMMEMVLILAGILKHFKLFPANDTPVKMAPLMTLRPDVDILVRLEKS